MEDLPHNVKQGLQAFNRGDFYLAHEYFEDAWRETPDEVREFYRALLHLSGGYYRLTQNRAHAARKFFHRSLHWIGQFPNPYLSIDTSALIDHLDEIITAIDSGSTPELILEHHIIQIQRPD